MEFSEPFADLQLLDDDDAVSALSSSRRDGEMRYKCELCNMRFWKKQQRKQHVKKHHRKKTDVSSKGSV